MSDRRDLHAPLGMNDPLQQRLDHMAPVDLDSLDGCARLHTRKDRKYIVDAGLLADALGHVEEEVRVLEINGNRWFTYRSVYFDTPDYEAYHLAARRRPNRYKVRSRTYVDEGTTVLEVKTRDRGGRTVKHRRHLDDSGGDLDSAVREFAAQVEQSGANAQGLVPVLTTSYRRATLLFPESGVRATIDSAYLVRDRDGAEAGFGAELIVETKTSGRPCALDRALWSLGARPQKISKYCTGLAAIHPELPANKWNRVLTRHFAGAGSSPPPDTPRGDDHNGGRDPGSGTPDAGRGEAANCSDACGESPVRRRRQRSLVTSAAVVAVGLLAAGCGPLGSASAEADSGTDPAVVADSVASDAVFDSSVVHSISVEFDREAYDEMIATYLESQDKEWIEATVTIDGETYEQAGIRLKGNSSLRGLAGAGMGTGGDVSSDDPTGLPWLIKLDKYVDDQNHEGVRDFVVRSNNSESSLNEALALELLGEAGLPTQEAMAVRFSINGDDEQLRLVIEHPDDVWMEENLDATGALYKAESTGDYSYRGDDPESYDEVFDQEAGKDNTDLTPLIEFLEFINDSDDATFEAELAEHLDVDAFATYLAMQELVDNFDDIDGPGNNSYLYYDSATGRFTVVPWDHNLAFGALNTTGGGPGTRGAPPGFGTEADAGTPGAPPEFGTGEVDGALPQARPEPPEGVGGGPGVLGPGGAGVPGGSNVLVERFLAVEEFNSLYETRLAELTEALIDSGIAEGILDQWASVLSEQAGDLIPAETLSAEVDQLRQAL